MATAEVPDAASDRHMSIQTIHNIDYKASLVVKTEYRDVGINIYTLHESKLLLLGSVGGASVEFEDIDHDGFEEIKVNEMDWLKSESMADAKYKQIVYQWDGQSYNRVTNDDKIYLVNDALKELAGVWHPQSENADRIIKIYIKTDNSGELVYGDLMTAEDSDPEAFFIEGISANTVNMNFDGEIMQVVFEDESHARFRQGDNIMAYEKTMAFDEPVDWLKRIQGYWMDEEMGFYFKIEASDDEVTISSTYGEGVFVRQYSVSSQMDIALDLQGIEEGSPDLTFYNEDGHLMMSTGNGPSKLTSISEQEYNEVAVVQIEGEY